MKYLYYSLIAMFFYGIAPLFAKAGLSGISPIQAMALRSLVVCVGIYAGILLSGRGSLLTGWSARGALFITLEALCAGLPLRHERSRNMQPLIVLLCFNSTQE